MRGYAESTTVNVDKTKSEIESTLRKYGAEQFISGWEPGRAVVMFKCKDRLIRFIIAMPDQTDKRFRFTEGRGKRRSDTHAMAEYEQDVRARWRRLLLCIKAKLESVQTGIESFEEAFLAQIVLPDNTTVGQWAAEAIPAALATRQMPSLLALPQAKGGT